MRFSARQRTPKSNTPSSLLDSPTQTLSTTVPPTYQLPSHIPTPGPLSNPHTVHPPGAVSQQEQQLNHPSHLQERLNGLRLSPSKPSVSPLKPPLPPTPSTPEYIRAITSQSAFFSPSSKAGAGHLRNPRVHFRPALQSYLSLLFTLILIALRRTSRSVISSSLSRQNVRLPGEPSHRLRLHIFTVPKPFVGSDRQPQLRALESWLSLTPKPVITLLGDSPSIRSVARAYRLRLDPNIETSFLGVPLLHSVLDAVVNQSSLIPPQSSKLSKASRLHKTSSTPLRTRGVVTVLLNADLVLFDDYVFAMRKLRASYSSTRQPWMAVAARWDIPSLQSLLPIHGPHKRSHDKARHAAASFVRTHGVLRTFGGVDLWAWETPPSLGRIPPFTIGRGRYDNWLTHLAIQSNTHDVIDISESVTVAHVRHSHHLVTGVPTFNSQSLLEEAQSEHQAVLGEGGEIDTREQREFWTVQSRRGFETIINAILAASTEGNYRPQLGTVLHAPLKLISCNEPVPLCLASRLRPHTCRCEHSPFVSHAHNDPYVVSGSNVVFCGLLSTNAGAPPLDERSRWSISGRLERTDENESDNSDTVDVGASLFGMPLTRKDVLTTISNQTDSDNVILIVADYSERFLVMQTVCSMRSTKVFQWLAIVALDDDMYQFCLLHGLAVYLADYDDSTIPNHMTFSQLARMQSVYEILQHRQYSVFSVSPGAIFHSSPWTYIDERVDNSVDIAFIPSSNLNESDDASVSAFYARPTNQALNLLKIVMADLERNTSSARNAGHAIWDAACGPQGQHMTRVGTKNMCKVKYGAKSHLFSFQKFRSFTYPTCRACSHWKSRVPVLLAPFALPAVDSDGNETRTIALQIKTGGFTRYEDGLCLWPHR